MALVRGVLLLLAISATYNIAEARCSAGFAFDPLRQTCNSVNAKQPQCPADQDPEILLPHEECNKYYMCYMGTLYVFTCPAGLEFDPETDQCDWPKPGGCSPSTTSGPETSTVTEPTTTSKPPKPTCGVNDNFKILPHESDCRKYYMCLMQKPIEKYCEDKYGFPYGFNLEWQMCVPIQGSSCAV